MGLSELVNLNVLRIFRVIRLLRAGARHRSACSTMAGDGIAPGEVPLVVVTGDVCPW